MEIKKKICLIASPDVDTHVCFEATFVPEIGTQVRFERRKPYGDSTTYNSEDAYNGELDLAGTVTSVEHKISQTGGYLTHVVFVHLDNN